MQSGNNRGEAHPQPNGSHDELSMLNSTDVEAPRTSSRNGRCNSELSSSASRKVVPGFVKDTGYSWVIFGAVFTDYCLCAIGLGAIGVLYPYFVDHFRCTMYEAGWIGSLHMAIGALIGLFVSPVLSRFGSRPVTMAGSVFGGLGYCSSYLAQSVSQMYLTFGVLAGIGNGMLLISSSVILQQYFEVRRTLATALATTAFGLSPLIVAPVTRWMAASLGWRWAILLLGCGYMQGAVAGSLMKPPPKPAKAPSNGDNSDSAYQLKDMSQINGKQSEADVDVQPQSSCLTNSQNVITKLCRMLNLSLLIDIRFIIMTLGSAMALFGYFAPFMFLPSHAQSSPLHLDGSFAATLVAIMALSMSVGRVISGLIGDRMSSMICCPVSCRKSRERRLFHYAIPMTLAGLANAGVVIWRSKMAIVIYSSLVGLLTGSYMVMQQPVLIDLLGLHRFAGSFGLFMMFNGLSSLACQPFAGWLADKSGTFLLPFLVCGLLQTGGGLMLIGLGVVRSCRSSKSSPIYKPAAQSDNTT